MNNWKIKSLYYGKITLPKSAIDGGIDTDLILDFPYTGYLLQNGLQNILVDTGIHEDNIVDGKAWGGYPAEGGSKYVLEALEKEGLTPKDIDTVIYTIYIMTMLDVHYYSSRQHYYQKDEYLNLINPSNSKICSDFDKRTPGDLAQLKTIVL